MSRDQRRSFLFSSLIAFATAGIVILAQNIGLAFYFPHLSRFTSDFSPTYLRREIAAAASLPGQTVFLGDSVLWGYRLRADQTAVSVLTSQGCSCRDFAFKNGGPPNYYVLTRLLLQNGARPKAVVLEVN